MKLNQDKKDEKEINHLEHNCSEKGCYPAASGRDRNRCTRANGCGLPFISGRECYDGELCAEYVPHPAPAEIENGKCPYRIADCPKDYPVPEKPDLDKLHNHKPFSERMFDCGGYDCPKCHPIVSPPPST